MYVVIHFYNILHILSTKYNKLGIIFSTKLLEVFDVILTYSTSKKQPEDDEVIGKPDDGLFNISL